MTTIQTPNGIVMSVSAKQKDVDQSILIHAANSFGSVERFKREVGSEVISLVEKIDLDSESVTGVASSSSCFHLAVHYRLKQRKKHTMFYTFQKKSSLQVQSNPFHQDEIIHHLLQSKS